MIGDKVQVLFRPALIEVECPLCGRFMAFFHLGKINHPVLIMCCNKKCKGNKTEYEWTKLTLSVVSE